MYLPMHEMHNLIKTWILVRCNDFSAHFYVSSTFPSADHGYSDIDKGPCPSDRALSVQKQTHFITTGDWQSGQLGQTGPI